LFEWLVTQISGNSGVVRLGREHPIAFPQAERSVANHQFSSGFRLPDSQNEPSFSEVLPKGSRLLGNWESCVSKLVGSLCARRSQPDHKKATSRTPDGKMPHESKCSPREIQNYLGRISGPLLDRIDLHIEVPAVKFSEITSERTGETSAQIRERVIAARRLQQQRFADRARMTSNARMGSKELKAHCGLDAHTLDLLKLAMADMNLSARAYDRILKVARTIADLAGSERLTSDHVSEAIQYRSLDRQIWS
jgi:hypothetical protein